LAYSETLGRLLEEEFTNETLPANLKEQYVECSVIFKLIEQAVASKYIVLNDKGELRFGFTVKLGTAQVKKDISIILKEGENIEFKIDQTTDFFKFLKVEDRKLSVKNGCDTWFPVLLSKVPIQNRRFFEIEITKAGDKYVMLGVTLFEYRNKK
jgi:hypothetical protein